MMVKKMLTCYMQTSLVYLQQGNVKKSKKRMKIVKQHSNFSSKIVGNLFAKAEA